MSILIYLATIFWSLFPNLIHVFQGGEDYINKVNETNLVSNGDFKDTSGWTPYRSTISTNNNILTAVGNVTSTIFTVYQTIPSIALGETYYFYAELSTPSVVSSINLEADNYQFKVSQLNPILNQWYALSGIRTIITDNKNIETVLRSTDTNTLILSAKNVKSFNVSQMKFKGVKDDDGVPFSELTNEQIKTQLDTWITEYGDLSFTITKDNTADKWFDTGFVEKTAERDFIDYLGYFFWLSTPPIMLFITLDLIRRLL